MFSPCLCSFQFLFYGPLWFLLRGLEILGVLVISTSYSIKRVSASIQCEPRYIEGVAPFKFCSLKGFCFELESSGVKYISPYQAHMFLAWLSHLLLLIYGCLWFFSQQKINLLKRMRYGCWEVLDGKSLQVCPCVQRAGPPVWEVCFCLICGLVNKSCQINFWKVLLLDSSFRIYVHRPCFGLLRSRV